MVNSALGGFGEGNEGFSVGAVFEFFYQVFLNEDGNRYVLWLCFQLGIGDGGEGGFVVPAGVSFFFAFRIAGGKVVVRHDAGGVVSGVVGVGGGVGTVEIVLAGKGGEKACCFFEGAGIHIGGEGIEDDEENRGGGDGKDGGESFSFHFLPADKEGPYSVGDDEIEGPPRFVGDVDGNPDKERHKEEEGDEKGEHGAFFPFGDIRCGHSGEDGGWGYGNVGVGDVLGGHEGIENKNGSAPGE